MNDTPKRPGDVKWIVSIPNDDPRAERCLVAACRGNRDIARMLNYFLFAASKEVESKKANATDDYITIRRNVETIADYLKISQKTVITYIRYLTDWGLVISHGYHHTYDVYHHKVEDTIKTPPAAEWPKLRGKHVKREDCTDGKSTIHENSDKRVDFLEQQIVNLQSEIVNLASRIVNLQSQMVNLQSLQSCESTLQAALEPVFDPLIITNESTIITNERESENSASQQLATFASSDASPSLLSSQQEAVSQKQETNQPQTQPQEQQALMSTPLTEPDMTGAWNADKCVQYAEYHNKKRLPDAQRSKQVESMRKLHREDPDVTLAQFKLIYDDWYTWWQEKGKGSLHASDLMVKQQNGFLRYRATLDRLESRKVISITQASTRPSVLVSEEQAAKNIARMRANVAAKMALQAN